MLVDCVMFGYELEMLEGRLNTLSPYVDKFIISESNHHFQNQPKDFVLEKEWDRFSEYHDKIIYVKVESKLSEDPWENEIQQRRSAEPILHSLNLSDSDFVTVCDVDEWWNPNQFPDNKQIAVFNMRKFNMSLHWFHKYELTGIGGMWGYLKNKDLDYERRKIRHIFPQIVGGVHLTTMGNVDNAIRKMKSYSHIEYNDDKIEEATRDCWERGYFYGWHEDGTPYKDFFQEVEFDNETPEWIREYKFPQDWYRRRK